MSSIKSLITEFKENPAGVKFADLCKVCDKYFGESRTSSSHRIYKTIWQGDPRINIQDDNGKAKAYQVREVLKALKKLGVV